MILGKTFKLLSTLTVVIVLSVTTYSQSNLPSNTQKIPLLNDSSEKQKTNFRIYEFKPLTIPDIVSILANIGTVATFILTFFLLKETQKQIGLGNKTAERDRHRLESEMVNLVYRNFRETYMSMMNDPDGVRVLTQIKEEKNNENKENDNGILKDTLQYQVEKIAQTKISMYSSFLINNVHEIFLLNEKGFIDPNIWSAFKVDIIDFFNYNFIKARWNEIHKLYPEKFKKFVNDFLNK